jgi:hypothetical protein
MDIGGMGIAGRAHNPLVADLRGPVKSCRAHHSHKIQMLIAAETIDY